MGILTDNLDKRDIFLFCTLLIDRSNAYVSGIIIIKLRRSERNRDDR